MLYVHCSLTYLTLGYWVWVKRYRFCYKFCSLTESTLGYWVSDNISRIFYIITTDSLDSWMLGFAIQGSTIWPSKPLTELHLGYWVWGECQRFFYIITDWIDSWLLGKWLHFKGLLHVYHWFTWLMDIGFCNLRSCYMVVWRLSHRLTWLLDIGIGQLSILRESVTTVTTDWRNPCELGHCLHFQEIYTYTSHWFTWLLDIGFLQSNDLL